MSPSPSHLLVPGMGVRQAGLILGDDDQGLHGVRGGRRAGEHDGQGGRRAAAQQVRQGLSLGLLGGWRGLAGAAGHRALGGGPGGRVAGEHGAPLAGGVEALLHQQGGLGGQGEGADANGGSDELTACFVFKWDSAQACVLHVNEREFNG